MAAATTTLCEPYSGVHSGPSPIWVLESLMRITTVVVTGVAAKRATTATVVTGAPAATPFKIKSCFASSLARQLITITVFGSAIEKLDSRVSFTQRGTTYYYTVADIRSNFLPLH